MLININYLDNLKMRAIHACGELGNICVADIFNG